ncbi:unnamed protein product [Rotaria sp. Silwood2]|nr:unnamed protein product [Rotaria sp. Silwood2]CAF2718747.1 unnamed protein product [Rotaria sp. Silwood2]CAF3121360.1 unnamed protein product [Rotaria sp. Silwood2]CAF4224755.1 unnamed protein product [Rotaria sp. Silwood2]CAF4431779.1 unnamed protein product [Rotaria sp. Silwood2]
MHALAAETKYLIIEARLNLTLLIGCILLLSFTSILLSIWVAKTITNSTISLGTIFSYYFDLDRNNTEQYITWWTPIHMKSKELVSKSFSIKTTNTTIKTALVKIHHNEFPIFHTIILPFLFICSIFLAILAYYARVQCTTHDFACGAIPKLLFESVDSMITKNPIVKTREVESNIDYIIVQGTKEKSIIFALADKLQPLYEEGDIVDEGTQYEPEDILKVITHVSSTS